MGITLTKTIQIHIVTYVNKANLKIKFRLK